MVKRGTKFSSTGLLSEKEREYLRNLNSRSISNNDKGQLRKRINKKMSQIDIYDLIFDLNHLLNEERIIQLIAGIFCSLSYENSRKFIENYTNNFLKDSEFKLENQRKYNEIKMNLKRVKNYELTFDERRELGKIKEKKKLEKELRRIYSSEDFVLRRKLIVDIRYIKQDRKRLEIFRFIHKKKKLKLTELYEKYSQLKHFISDFYERGIIIPIDLEKEKFIALCRKLISQKKFKRLSKIPPSYEIYPLQLKNKNTLVKLNPYYDYFKVGFQNFKKESSTYYFIDSELRSLLIDNPNEYPEEFYPSSTPSTSH